MGVFIDILKRVCGDTVREEDYSRIYFPTVGPAEGELLYSGSYDNVHYQIASWGDYPMLGIHLPISALEGIKQAGDWTLQSWIKIDEFQGTSDWIYYSYNKEKDYIYGRNGGKKYNVPEIIKDAEMFIEQFNKQK